jgi:adenosylcobinamide-phosphate synthase
VTDLIHPAPWAVSSLAVLLALAVDRLWGEPPARWHPVVWMGHYLGAMGRRVAPSFNAPAPRPAAVLVRGALAWLLGAALVVALAAALVALVTSWAWWWQALALGLLLKPLLAWRMLRDEVQAVESALASSLAEGRARLAWLVSRDVTTLDAAQVRESAIETLAENLNDSVVAPLFWFAVAGLPGAALYRFANTADAMWGYRGERQGRDWTWAGKWAARADDVLSWVPARITAVLLAGLGAVGRWRQLPAQAALHRPPTAAGPWPPWRWRWTCTWPSPACTRCTPQGAARGRQTWRRR